MAESVWGNSLPLLVIVGLLAFLVTCVAIKAGFYRSLPAAVYPRTPTSMDLFFVVAGFFVYNQAFPFILSTYLILFQKVLGLSKQLSLNAKLWLVSLNIWLTIPVLGYVFRELKPSTLLCVLESDAVETKSEWVYNLSLGAFTWFICYPVVNFLNLILSEALKVFFHLPETDQVAVKLLKMTFSSPTLLAFYLSAIVLIVPIIEEFIFRGIILRWLTPKVGPWRGILISSVIFAAVHYSASQGMYNLQLLPALFMLSCYLGYLYERQRSLWAPIGLHMTFNLISSIVLIYQG